MSLNPSEQMVFDYIQTHPEERQYWVGKVQKTSRAAATDSAAVAELALELWRYYEERSAVVSPFREVARQHGEVRRTSMKNLAEHLLRVWGAARPKKNPPTNSAGEPGF